MAQAAHAKTPAKTPAKQPLQAVKQPASVDGRARLAAAEIVEAWAAIGELYIPGYQRLPNMKRVEEMSRHFDPALLERILCNLRPGDARMYVVDGQHRLAMLRELDWTEAPITIHTGWSEDQERERFEYLNSSHARRALTAYDIHHAGGPRAHAIDQAVESQGFKVSSTSQPASERVTQRRITSVRALERIYDSASYGGEEGIRETLWYVKKTWDNQPGMLRSEILEGMHRFLMYAKSDRAFNDEHVIKALMLYPPQKVIRDAALRAPSLPGRLKMPRMVAALFRERYNYGLKGERQLSFVDYGYK